MFVRVFLLSLSLALGVQTWAAEKRDCEILLNHSFQGLVEVALQREVLSAKNLEELANSPTPINPLHKDRVESAAHLQFFKAFQTILQNPGSSWPQVREWTQTKLSALETLELQEIKSVEVTKNIFRPRLAAAIPIDSVKEIRWREENSHAILELIGSVGSPTPLAVQTNVPFRAVEIPEPISVDDLHADHLITQAERLGQFKEPEHVWDLHFFHQQTSSGEVTVALRRSAQRRSSTIEIISTKNETVRHEQRFAGESVDALFRRNGNLAFLVSIKGEVQYLERNPEGNYTVAHLVTPKDGNFEPSLSLHETKDGEILVAAARSHAVYVFNPGKSEMPFRSYSAEKAAVAWFERDIGHSSLLVLPETTSAFAAEPLVSERVEPFGERILGEEPSRAETIVLKNGQVFLAYSIFTHEQPAGIKILIYELYGPAN